MPIDPWHSIRDAFLLANAGAAAPAIPDLDEVGMAMQVLGGLAIFLLGMRNMSDGLQTIAGPTLVPTPTARRLADAVLHPPLALLPRVAGDVGSVVTLGLLPPAIRERYGLRWDRTRERGFAVARGLVRGVLPLLPDVLRAMPQARRAERARSS